MSYEPSHRKPPRQERWPNATPGEGWPAYQQDEGRRAWESAAAYAGSRNGYAANDYISTGYGGTGYGYGATTTAYPPMGDGFDGAADGYASGYAEDYGQAWDRGYVQPEGGYPIQDSYPALEDASSVLVAPDTMGEWWRDQGRDGQPGHRGAAVGVMMGVLAAAVALGVATFAAAFVRPQAAPVSVVGGVLFDRVPAALKSTVTTHFGAHAKTVLLLGAIGLIAVMLGWMARRNPSIGVAGIATFGLLGAFIIITRPESRASDVIPSAIGGLAGIIALLWLARASAPVASGQPTSARPAYSGGSRRRTR